ncbi:exported hypothetical protein [Mesorhizobium sp. STM 4661]|nr:exported hypothetical protein [Mesorhizobium sp. STM 4661]
MLILKPEGLFLCIVAAVIVAHPSSLCFALPAAQGSKAAGWANGGAARHRVATIRHREAGEQGRPASQWLSRARLP